MHILRSGVKNGAVAAALLAYYLPLDQLKLQAKGKAR